MAGEPTSRADGGRELPAYVCQQPRFYAAGTKHARWGYAATEFTSIAAAPAVPLAVAARSPDWVTAIFGAIAAISTGLRQAFNFRENWILRAVAREAVKADVALYVAAGDRTPSDELALIRDVRATNLAETARWKDLVDHTKGDDDAAQR
jgi:Protein of unknown function (DUF4231)